ncbi:MAG: DUF748 domain-containing protein [Chitinophagaceae bacterium]
MWWKRQSKKRKTILIVFGSLLVLLIAFRIALPYILLRYVNKQLTMIDGYKGHVDDIDVSLYRGAYTIQDIYLNKTGGAIPVPFFKADEIDLSVEWSALFNGEIVAEINVDRPVMNFVKGPSKATSQTDIDDDWTQVVDKLIPFKLNRFEVNNGEAHYRDLHSSPKVDIVAKNIHIVAENLSNAKHQKELLPSTVTATAGVYEGQLSFNMKLDALNKVPTFDFNAKMTSLNLVNLNDFLKAYGNFDVEKGSLSLYTEAAARDQAFKGYVKPLITDTDVVSWKNDKDKPLQFVWESVVGGITWLFTNHKKDQLATRADFEGRFDNPNFDFWSIIGQILRNAFIQALYPSLENSVNINSVGKGQEEKKPSLLKRIFQKKNKDKK